MLFHSGLILRSFNTRFKCQAFLKSPSCKMVCLSNAGLPEALQHPGGMMPSFPFLNCLNCFVVSLNKESVSGV